MTAIFENYYKEKKDADGNIVEVSIDYPDDFNFAYDVVDRFGEEQPNLLALLHKQVYLWGNEDTVK